MGSLSKTDPAAYFLSYAVSDANSATIAATTGSLIVSSESHRRQADVMMRVGSATLDNTHSQSRPSGITSGSLPSATMPTQWGACFGSSPIGNTNKPPRHF